IEYKVKDIEIEDPAQKASLSLVVSSTNYTDINTNLNFTIIAKKWAKIGGFSVDSKTYDGKPVVMNGKPVITSQDGGLLVGSKELVFNYLSADDGVYKSPTPPLMPGKYYLVITLPKTAYGYYAKTVIPFTIEKAVINISTPSFEIYQGQETFPEVPITFTGFVNKETAAVFNVNTLKAEHSVPDTVVPGKYPIRYTGELSSDRYNFNYSTGVLTIVKVAKYPAVDPIPEKISGITVYVPPKSLPDKIDSFEELALSINAISPADDRLITQVMQNKSGFKNYKKMDIKLIEILTGKAVQPKGKVTISMPYPNSSDSTMNFKVLHLLKNGTKIEVITPTKVVGGLQFKVSEFSPFIIGWEPNIKTEDTDFFITNAQITTEKKQFTVAVRENARKASYALTKFFEASTGEKSVVLKNPDVIITFDKNALKVTDNSPSYDFYATKNACEHELAARALGGEGVLAVIHFNQEGYWPGTAQVSVNMGKELKG
ncbi:MAG: MBG domain-containing protein, partial [Oscillospiraceae bacterium]